MIYTLLFLLLTFLILTQSDISLYYAFYGFSLWYSKMIPALLPFMILSGILIRMNLSERFAGLLHPVLKHLFRCSANVSYGIIIGFLCGFPMGAKVTADLLKHQKITYEEAKFLLAFNNNIGPVYFCSFVIPLLNLKPTLPYLFGMYGIPLLYGMLLRRTIYKSMPIEAYKHTESSKEMWTGLSLLTAMDDSIKNSVQSILSLCGYMILFNTLNLLPHFLLPQIHIYLAPVLEITGGLSMLDKQLPIYSLCMLTFGGLSCIAQTNSMIRDTGLFMKNYVFHKVILTGLSFIYYLCAFSVWS